MFQPYHPGREAGYSFVIPWWIGHLEICWLGAIPEPPSGPIEEIRTYGRQRVPGDVPKATSAITLETGNSIEDSFNCKFVTPSTVKYVFLHGDRVGCLTCKESSSSVLLSLWSGVLKLTMIKCRCFGHLTSWCGFAAKKVGNDLFWKCCSWHCFPASYHIKSRLHSRRSVEQCFWRFSFSKKNIMQKRHRSKRKLELLMTLAAHICS